MDRWTTFCILCEMHKTLAAAKPAPLSGDRCRLSDTTLHPEAEK